jgi:hypothetical protein
MCAARRLKKHLSCSISSLFLPGDLGDNRLPSFAIILCACDFNYIRRCDSQPICDTNRACFSSGDFSFAAFSELFGPGQVCYWKTWLSGSNSPCSSASILRSGLRYGPRQ